MASTSWPRGDAVAADEVSTFWSGNESSCHHRPPNTAVAIELSLVKRLLASINVVDNVKSSPRSKRNCLARTQAALKTQAELVASFLDGAAQLSRGSDLLCVHLWFIKGWPPSIPSLCICDFRNRAIVGLPPFGVFLGGVIVEPELLRGLLFVFRRNGKTERRTVIRHSFMRYVW